jgi:hypothetical protein
MPLTSLEARPKLQSQTGFDGCEAVGSDSPIKRNLRHAGGLSTGGMCSFSGMGTFLFVCCGQQR